MSHTPLQEPPAPGLTTESGQTLPSRPLQPTSDPSASKRVCFYKSGDNKFTGQRLVINSRTFKTFDALLDALSKKVPLPFGVRTITTPRGTHPVNNLDDLHDGGSYVCSDQKRVKPLNLNEVNRQQVPWNTTRPISAGQRGRRGIQFAQFGRRNKVPNRPARINDRTAVRTPKRLVVIKNRDPSVKRTIVLQRRTAPTFDALLDYLSQIMQFPVLKLFSMDGRRIDGLAALILCSGVIVAAGNEPFRLGNNSRLRRDYMAQTVNSDAVEPPSVPPVEPQAQNTKSFSSGRGSRKFSLSSEQYIVNQINKSRNGSMSSHLHHHNGSYQRDVNQHQTSTDTVTCESTRVDRECHTSILPHEDDIEKSFRVNQDGSMTVDMKVRLTIKEEEMLHWTTTLSRSSLSKRPPVCASVSGSGNISPDSNNALANRSSFITEEEPKEENHPTVTGKGGVGFSDERVYEGDVSKTSGKIKPSFKRTPTPGPRRVKKASAESVRMVTESGVQESTMGHYSYTERTSDCETTVGYCVVRHSSSSNRPVPKPRKTASAGASEKASCSSIKSAGVAEVLQIQNNGMEITETVMHICESQGCYDNYFPNNDFSTEDKASHCSNAMPQSEPAMTASVPRSSSNDCDVDLTWQPSSADSPHRWKEEILSLSSETIPATHEIRDNLAPFSGNEAQIATNSRIQSPHESKKVIKPTRKQKSSPSISSSGKKQKESLLSPLKNTKGSSANKLDNANVGKKSSSEIAKSGQKSKPVQKLEIKKSRSDDNAPRKGQSSLFNTAKKTPAKKQMNTSKGAPKDNGPNVNTSVKGNEKPSVKKNSLNILQPKKSVLPDRKTITKHKSKTENRTSSPKRNLGLSESISVPSLNPSPSDIHQYVENWLQKVSPESVPYREEAEEQQTKPVFQIGADSESDDKTECQTDTDVCHPLQCDAVKKSSSCVLEPLYREEPTTAVTQNEQRARTVHEENRLQTPQLAELNILSPKAKIKAVLKQICSSVQNIRGISESVSASNLQKSRSLPDFSSQVSSVFGSSCKVFLSFLSAVTLRDTFTGCVHGDSRGSRNTSEAMLLMESLQKISAIEDEEEQRASLTDLQSRTSSQFREGWKEFQILRDRLENEPLSLKCSEKEFAQEVDSEGGDAFDDQHLHIDKLMEELCIPQDLRGEISSTLQQSKSFYRVKKLETVEKMELTGDEEKVEDKGRGDEFRHEVTGKNAEREQVKGVNASRAGSKDREVGDTKEEDDDGEERENEMEDEAEEGEENCDEWQEEQDTEMREDKSAEIGESVERAEEGTEEELTADEEEERNNLEGGTKEVGDEMEEGLVGEEDKEARGEDSVEEMDEKETCNDKVVEGADEEKQGTLSEEEEDEVRSREQEKGDEGEKSKKEPERDGEVGQMSEVNAKAGQEVEGEEIDEYGSVEDEEKQGDELNEGCDWARKQELRDEANEGNKHLCDSVTDDADISADGETLLEEADYLLQRAKANYEVVNGDPKGVESSNTLSDIQCEDEKGNGTDSVNENKTDYGEYEEGRGGSHPVQISQELLDFVNAALQSSSLIFTYDTQGNIRIEPDNVPGTQAKQTAIPKCREDSSYGLKRLPSPSTSDLSGLSDYRPETSESGGYQTQESLDVVTESGEDVSERASPDNRHTTETQRTNVENSKSSIARHSEHLQSSRLKSRGSFSSYDSGTKASTENLSSASSFKAEPEHAAKASEFISFASEKDSNDGVLIDKGRWLLRENHLIRKSPPVSIGMYGDLDSTSTDTSQDSPPHDAAQHNPLAAISSSELEEMAKPSTPKCTYFNMSHGSDSDPFPDDLASVKSGRKGTSSVTGGRGLRISPTVDTSKNWANKNGSLSSFASVEFRLPDSRVHPEDQSSAVTQARRPSSAGRSVLQAQDSLETLRVRCGRYCPIL